MGKDEQISEDEGLSINFSTNKPDHKMLTENASLKNIPHIENSHNIPRPFYLLRNPFQNSFSKEKVNGSDSTDQKNSLNITKSEYTGPPTITPDKKIEDFSTFSYLKYTYTPDQAQDIYNNSTDIAFRNILANNEKPLPHMNNSSSYLNYKDNVTASTKINLTNAPDIKINLSLSEQNAKNNFVQPKITDSYENIPSSSILFSGSAKGFTEQVDLNTATQGDIQNETGNKTLHGITGKKELLNSNSSGDETQAKHHGSFKLKISPVSKLLQLCPSAGKRCNRRLLERCLKHLKHESSSNCRVVTYDDVMTAADGHNPTEIQKSLTENTKKCFRRLKNACSREGFDCIVDVFYIKENKEAVVRMC